MSFFKKLKETISNIVHGKNNKEVSNIEDLLIEADFGINLAEALANKLRNSKNIEQSLKEEINNILKPLIKDIIINRECKPFVITLCGVNGCGKTTTVAKLINKFNKQGLKVDVAACDTFRAAADDQLESWTSKLNANEFGSHRDTKLYKGTNKDPASVAYNAITSTNSDVLIVDTAGRLPTNTNLMNELSKIYRVLNKVDNEAPQLNVLVLDATTGQNAFNQVQEFNKVSPLNGIILAKIDGGAKGGTIVNIANTLQIPILGVGTGEGQDNFEMFSIDKFLKDLMRD